MFESSDAVMQTASEESRDAPVRSPCHPSSMPGLDPASEGDESSCSWSESSSNHTSAYTRDRATSISSSNSKKRVSWGRIHTREYALVVGEHPLCQDGLPVSLDWQHADDAVPPKLIPQAPKVSERTQSYVFPRRLSYEERRRRLCCVSGLTEDQVKNDEIELVVRTLEESWKCATNSDMSSSLDPTPIADDDDVIMSYGWEEAMNQDIDIDLVDMDEFEWTD
eukprot:Nitzschia sp. Nitz4//scaffold406_size10313//5930//6598//NITZ4_009076-RA/size10313-processed-gene-0.5-mRNA-1//-1//CDS//3329551128//7189//frame0